MDASETPSASFYLCNRLAAGLGQPHCLLFEFACVNFLDLCHAHPFPDLLEYSSALGTLPNRGRLTPELCGFVQSLKKDYEAVKAGLTLAWSQGPVEGHVHRLKLLKRQAYGRASFQTLRKRVLRCS